MPLYWSFKSESAGMFKLSMIIQGNKQALVNTLQHLCQQIKAD